MSSICILDLMKLLNLICRLKTLYSFCQGTELIHTGSFYMFIYCSGFCHGKLHMQLFIIDFGQIQHSRYMTSLLHSCMCTHTCIKESHIYQNTVCKEISDYLLAFCLIFWVWVLAISIEGRKFLYQLGDCYFLKDSAVWGQIVLVSYMQQLPND